MKSDSCTLFRHAVLVKITENNQTNAGICPKSDPNYELIKRYYYSASPDNITTHIPDTQYFWCSDKLICTFPFFYNSELYYEPVYINGSVDGTCGTDQTSTNPVFYSKDSGFTRDTWKYSGSLHRYDTKSSTNLCPGNNNSI